MEGLNLSLVPKIIYIFQYKTVTNTKKTKANQDTNV